MALTQAEINEVLSQLQPIIAKALNESASIQQAQANIQQGVTQYVGARYVPLFAKPIQWSNDREYEPLTIVLYEGNSYTTVQYTPVGIDISNEEFWACTGNYNAQIEQYRKEVSDYVKAVNAFDYQIKSNSADIVNEENRAKNAENALSKRIDLTDASFTGLASETDEKIFAIQTSVASLSSTTPIFVSAVSQMTDTSKIYVLTSNSHVYTHNGSNWADTGVTYSSPNTMHFDGNQSAPLSAPYDDLNTVPVNTIIQYSATTAKNIPEPISGELLTFGYANDLCAQIYAPVFGAGNYFWYRTSNRGGGFKAWVKIPTPNTMHFDGNQSAPLSAPYDDLNTVPVNTIIQYSATTAKNIPEPISGELLTFGYANDLCAQIYAPVFGAGNYFWYRTCNQTSGFKAWVKIGNSVTVDTTNYANLFALYDNIIACGDSLTYCQVYTGTRNSRRAKKLWPNVIAQESNNNAHIFAYGGYTAEQWYTAYHSDAIVPRDNQIFIVYLGTNAGLTDTVDTDCPSGLPSSQWAKTQTGYYGRILSEIIAAGSTAILIKPHVTSGDITQTKKAIDDFSNRFNLPIIEDVYMAENCYHRWPNGTGHNAVHYNDLGYVALAYNIINKVNQLDSAEKSKLFK